MKLQAIKNNLKKNLLDQDQDPDLVPNLEKNNKKKANLNHNSLKFNKLQPLSKQ